MDKPVRDTNHVLSNRSRKYFDRFLPDSWVATVPQEDYGIDFYVDIVIDGKVSGLNFSVQLKSTANGKSSKHVSAILKRSTLGFLRVRLEPVMVVVYEESSDEAYWCWLTNGMYDLSNGHDTYSIPVTRQNKWSKMDWNELTKHVQRLFNNKTFIGDFDLSKVHSDVELIAWKAYFRNEFGKAVYLFRELQKESDLNDFALQALAWSLYMTHQYRDALFLINQVLKNKQTDNLFQTKACILAEMGREDKDRGKVLQAKELFESYASKDVTGVMSYNYGNTLSSLGEIKQAVIQYKKSLKIDSSNARCWKNLGTAYYDLQKHDKELQCYDEALSIDPELEEAMFSKGITLAQIYANYQEALELFNRVLSKNNSVKERFVNGLFWVAYCYEQIGDLKNALYWVNTGLELEGSNRYLLNFKSNFLAEYWPTYPEFKDVAEKFFNYRIALEGDYLSIYHLVVLKKLSMAETVALLSEHIPLFERLTAPAIESTGMDTSTIISILPGLELYLTFRRLFSLDRFKNMIDLGEKFWALLELFAVQAFNTAFKKYEFLKSADMVAYDVLANLTSYLPLAIPNIQIQNKMIHKNGNDLAAAIEKMLLELIDIEFKAQARFILRQFGLENMDCDSLLIKTTVNYFREDLHVEIEENLHLMTA
ncbi:DUF4365 domain-containing protein [Mucilaginibacter sp. PAMB04274]|uniref:DUF4365 domain-containing protein n=1 Tax=Mucilaginibacter sp. PAMB04274 TaxID=3138568 RepID=UPI0031F70123